MNIPPQATFKGLLRQMFKMRFKAGNPVLEEVTAQIIGTAPEITPEVPPVVPPKTLQD